MVLRDVARAFEKVWHSEPPDIIENILCSFLDSRKEKNKHL